MQRERIETRAKFELHYGDTTLFWGKQYPIGARPGTKAGFDETGFYLPPGLSPVRIKDGLIQIYRAQAVNVLDRAVRSYASRMKVEPTGIRVTGAKTIWGSCSSSNRLSFSWKLMMIPFELVEYIVVHELAHIREHNHSPRFWAIVESFLPDYQDRKNRLKLLQRELDMQDWDELSE